MPITGMSIMHMFYNAKIVMFCSCSKNCAMSIIWFGNSYK